MYPTREKAWEIFTEYNKDEHLIKHGLTVEGVMRHFAKLYNGNPDEWGVVGLLHDVDYELYPEEHCKKTIEILNEMGIDEEVIHAIISHGYGLVNDVLTGLITAAAIMRPSKSVLDITVKSVKKKYKSKGFAAGVNREVIENGCQMLNKELNEVIEETILGMREVAEEIGLKGDI